jgi:hypothetical protein
MFHVKKQEDKKADNNQRYNKAKRATDTGHIMLNKQLNNNKEQTLLPALNLDYNNVILLKYTEQNHYAFEP